MGRHRAWTSGAAFLVVLAVLWAGTASAQELDGPLDAKASLKLRLEGQDAFYAADYEKMAAIYGRLCDSPAAELEDHLWHGHAWQLSGKWLDAVRAYKRTLPLIERDVGDRRPQLRQRDWTHLILQIGRMEHHQLREPAAAAKTLAEAIRLLDKARAKVDPGRLGVLRELALAQEAAGEMRAAFKTWARLHRDAHRAGREPFGTAAEVERIARALDELPPGEGLPDTPMMFVLTPDAPRTELNLDDAAARERSYRPSSGPHALFAFAPPPGKEFASLEFACDIEQLAERAGGHFRSFVMTDDDPPLSVTLGSISFSGKQVPGRETTRQTFNVPPGVRAVHVETGSWKDHFTVHRVEVEATFRPVTRDAEPLKTNAKAWVQTELIPDAGTVRCGDRVLTSGRSVTIEPGTHRVHFEVPGIERTFETDLVVRPGKRHGLFVNLHSPFRWTPAGPEDLGGFPPARTSIARLPDGSFLAAWCATGGRIMLSRTRDLVTWSRPEPAPLGAVFQNIAPATLTDADGTVWLAFFSDRISLMKADTGGYTLWLTSTRDGGSWTPPRPVAVGQVGGWPLGAVHMFRDKAGRHWVFWREDAASGQAMTDIRRLDPVSIEHEGGKRLHVWNPHVTVDDDGLYHMVFDNFGRGIYHTTSKDGWNWTLPKLLVEEMPGRPVRGPQLILRGARAVLMYETTAGAYVVPARLEGPPHKPWEGMKITNHVIPLGGARLTLTDDGRVLLLAGADTSWLLSTTLRDLLGI
ncbi:MAG TPA: hypothetical protein VMZ92_16765 [Planctomycetota bacterium]|nr:hypothetical protein [Planctomycetota bacterium]